MQNRIEVNPEVCHGKPVIRNTRIMLRNILGSLAGGDSISDIIKNYPELTHEDVEAARAADPDDSGSQGFLFAFRSFSAYFDRHATRTGIDF